MRSLETCSRSRQGNKQLFIYIFLYPSLQIMSILNFVESRLGSLKNWPHDILRYIFYVKPRRFTTLQLAAFFYGNKIPLDTAFELYQECNNPTTKDIELFRKKYEIWQ